jgi:hypothetical protein
VHAFAQEPNRKFKLKANGDLVRKNPDGTSYYFKITSSISLQSDEKEGLCVLWLARDLKSEKELTIYVHETSARMVYDTGEAAQYSMNCNSPENFDSPQEPLTLR